MSDPLAHQPIGALLEELVQAHLDTIELLLERGSVDEASHVDYLRALVREAKATTAVPAFG